MAGLFVRVREVRDGVAYVAVRTPLRDPDSRRDLEDRLTRRLPAAEPSLLRVEVSYDD